jgi:hypothetical protein
MAEDRDRNREDGPVGSDSTGSQEAALQAESGRRGAEQRRTGASDEQPPQASQRAPAARHQQPPEATKHFAEGHAPSEQGEKDHPSPEVVKRHQQGAEPRSGSHSAKGERVEEESQRGEPDHGHTREGRQHTPGHRPGHRS